MKAVWAAVGLGLFSMGALAEEGQTAKEPTCGEQMAEMARLPKKLSEVTFQVAATMEAHARWVGTKTPEAKAEYDALMKIAAAHRALSKKANEAAEGMLAAKELRPATHSAQMPPALVESIRKQSRLEEEFADMVSRNAAQSTEMLQELGGKKEEGMGGSGKSDAPTR